MRVEAGVCRVDCVLRGLAWCPGLRSGRKDHHVYDEAKKGQAWPGDILGHQDAVLHTAGWTENSMLTSWTTDPDVALRFATKEGTMPGVILRVHLSDHAQKVVANEIRVGDESEVLIRGIVRDADVFPVTP